MARAMSTDDLSMAIELHRAGVLNLKAAAWALARYRQQRGKDIDPADVMAKFGAKRANAYRVVAELRLAMAALTHQSVHDSWTGDDDAEGGETHQEVHETWTGTHKPVHDSENPGIQESWTNSPRNVDSTQYKGSRELESACSSRTHAHASAHAREDPDPIGPSPEPERQAVVRFTAEVTAGALEVWAASACRIYPAAWVRALVERKAVGGPLPRIGLLNAILQQWAQARHCEYLDAPSLRATGTDPRPCRRGPDVESMHFED